ncbi:MAG: GNAT family N-acetyltransferase, partial [Actinomycetota bacterium]|nr:GNAT family N-acetyltransferase [Actinomycetota bacterium]
MPTTTFTIDEVAIPQVVDAPNAAAFVRAIELGNAVEAIGFGTPDLAFEPDEELPHWKNPQQPMRLLVARVDDRIVGRGIYETQVGEQSDSGWLVTQVLPEFRGHGIGTALADAVESMARADGKAKALVYTGLQDAAGSRIPSPTGFGSIPAEHPDVRFLLARGYRFEQVERLSRLPLPVRGLDDLVTAAAAASGPDYVVHTYVGATPERWLDDLALLATRMSTDAPSAGLEEPEDVWTAERIVESDARSAQSPRTRLTAVVEHVPFGRLAGFTVLNAPRQRHRSVAQWATLVLREHRGHRLGMLLKVANLQHLARVAPGHPSVTTFNAEENR